jgi:hypothetical protein
VHKISCATGVNNTGDKLSLVLLLLVIIVSDFDRVHDTGDLFIYYSPATTTPAKINS